MMDNTAGPSDDTSDIYASSTTLTCTSSCGINEFAPSCSLAAVNPGTPACPINCGACTTCPAGTGSPSEVGVTSLTTTAAECVDANCLETEYVGVDGTWYVLSASMSQ